MKEKKVQSPSSIKTYKQCPRKYYYSYILGLEQPPNVHTVRGNIAHSVLEHFFDPLAILKKLQNYLKDDGIIIITLPNIANWEIIYNLLRGHFDYQEDGILDEGHLRFFTYATANNLINSFFIMNFWTCCD